MHGKMTEMIQTPMNLLHFINSLPQLSTNFNLGTNEVVPLGTNDMVSSGTNEVVSSATSEV